MTNDEIARSLLERINRGEREVDEIMTGLINKSAKELGKVHGRIDIIEDKFEVLANSISDLRKDVVKIKRTLRI